ncbi:MAG: tetratricopeptide repeat protein [Arenimonas sp.]
MTRATTQSGGIAMPVLGIGLHVIIALFFAIHAMRTNQDKYWFMILFAFPGLGSLIYGLMIWLPDARNTRHGRTIESALVNVLDPSRELRQAQEAMEIAATPDNRIRLAHALLNAKRPSEAIPQYQSVLNGIYANDPKIQTWLAKAFLESGDFREAKELLDLIIKVNPNYKSPEGHLIYARALSALDERKLARDEYEVLVGYYVGLEARARYAEALIKWDDPFRAKPLLEDSLKIARRMPSSARRLNQEWIAILEKSSTAIKAK